MFQHTIYTDPYCRELVTTIVGSFPYTPKLRAVILEDTCVYPEGGGQPADRGTLFLGDRQYAIVDCQKRAGTILHLIEAGENEYDFPVGAEVRLSIDWERRFDHMQQHSGEHLISGICHERHGYDNVGFHISEDYMVIDFNGELSAEEIAEIERLANLAVWKNIQIEALYPTPEEAVSLDYRAKKEVGEELRLIQVPGYDLCACCGTQLKNTGEIGEIRIRRFERHRGGTRIYACCGERSLKMAQAESAIIDDLVGLLSTSKEQLSNRIAELIEEKYALERKLRQQKFAALRTAAEDCKQDYLLLETSDLNAAEQKEFAKELAVDFPRFVFLYQVNGERLNIVALRSPDSSLDYDLRDLLASLREEFTVKAGGQKNFIQGQLETGPDQLLEFFELDE
ncbi:MAG: alanyl-tRNA editing protein [Eubacteriales bacterium]|nr:alanyl-tRNA editing protein [Eubacteriales bacterium]